jgi:hypothetical protein
MKIIDSDSQKKKIEMLKKSSPEEVLSLFKTLAAPDFSEMDGEYEATLTNHGNVIINMISKISVNNPIIGSWLCKAFTPSPNNISYGYNSFLKNGTIRRIYPMKTEIANSRYDNKPIFQLTYGYYVHMLGKVNMVDEIRKLEDGLYLGIGTYGFTNKQRMIPLPFILRGPIGKFVGTDRPPKVSK